MLNTVCLMGRLTDEPKIYEGDNGNVSRFSIAVNAGEDVCYFFDVKAFDKKAAIECLHKGDQVGISGKLVQEKYTRKDGSNGAAILVVANNIEFGDVLPNNFDEEEEAPAPAPTPKPVAKPKRTR